MEGFVWGFAAGALVAFGLCLAALALFLAVVAGNERARGRAAAVKVEPPAVAAQVAVATPQVAVAAPAVVVAAPQVAAPTGKPTGKPKGRKKNASP